MSQDKNQTERLLIAGRLFKQPTDDLVEIKAKIKAMPKEQRDRLAGLVDWIQEYNAAHPKD